MADPIAAGTRPDVREVEPGTYAWCACGRSGNQPYCDGSHQGTGITPVPMTFTEKKTVAFCMCKRTGSPGNCDGSHKSL